jgi:hypothetical protein
MCGLASGDATPDDNANQSANSRKQIRHGLGLRTPCEMATIGKFENTPSVLFNLWRQ